ncbi:hypothetical protein RUND412_003868 [Rhizina undulata]
MKNSVILATVGAAAYAAAHGIVQDLNVDGTWWSGYLPYNDPYDNPVPERIVWAFPNGGNGPVEDVTSSAITCNLNATAAQLTSTAAAGSNVSFYWTTWPSSHKGPVMTYMANCGGDCTSVDATTLSYFKINEAGYSDGTWASDTLIANNNSWSVTIPSDIIAGNYLIRHELLALHSAETVDGAQFYPMCANVAVTGGGSAEPTGVKFPGAYSATDPGILVNIYSGLTNYTIPGPAVYTSGGSTAAVAAISAAAGTTAAAATTAAAVETSAAAVETSVVAVETSVAAVETTAAAVKTTAAAVATQKAITSAVAANTKTPTTMLTLTRASTTAAAAAASSSVSCYSTSVDYNKCLDEVNVCIASMQSKTGGAVDFSSCTNQRSNCKMC